MGIANLEGRLGRQKKKNLGGKDWTFHRDGLTPAVAATSFSSSSILEKQKHLHELPLAQAARIARSFGKRTQRERSRWQRRASVDGILLLGSKYEMVCRD